MCVIIIYGVCVLSIRTYINSCDDQSTWTEFTGAASITPVRSEMNVVYINNNQWFIILEIKEVEVFSKLKPHQFTLEGT